MTKFRYTKEWLYNAYVNQLKSMDIIAKELHLHDETIRYWMKKYDIPIRSKSIAGKLYIERVGGMYLEETRIKIAESLKKYYKDNEVSDEVRKRMSDAHIGLNRGNKSPSWKGGPIEYICEICGLKFKKPRTSKPKGGYRFCSTVCYGRSIIGDKHPQWKDGASFEPYCPKFNFKKKEEIRNLYNRVCVVSGISVLQNGRRLDVDHTDENKMQGCNGVKWRLVPLTNSIHLMMNNKQNHLLLELLLYGNKRAELNYEFEGEVV